MIILRAWLGVEERDRKSGGIGQNNVGNCPKASNPDKFDVGEAGEEAAEDFDSDVHP
jgi:hypothetical protein